MFRIQLFTCFVYLGPPGCFVYLFTCLSICLSVYLFIHLFIHLFTCLLVLFICFVLNVETTRSDKRTFFYKAQGRATGAVHERNPSVPEGRPYTFATHEDLGGA